MVDRRTKAYKAAQSPNVALAAPMAAAPVQAAPEPVSDAVAPKFRRKRASTGGFKLRLDAPKRPGFVRRFVKNDPSRILTMQELGYDFAQADTRTDGLGSHIERHAGTKATGEPEHLVLMETPESEYAIGVAEKEEQRQPFEQALRAGRATSGELTDQYELKHDKSSLNHTAR